MAQENFANRTLFHGDNLNFLRGINTGSIDLIATDPPFNKGKDFHATPDSLAKGASFQDRWSWEQDVHQSWVDKIEDDFPAIKEVYEAAREAHSKSLSAFLCFMGVRLIEMQRVLKPTGSIYLHCDPTASHYLKAMMDAVFGGENFRNEIVWCYKTGGVGKKWFARKHDIIFLYSRGKKSIFHVQKEKSYNRCGMPYRFKGVEEFQDEQGQWYTMSSLRDVWEVNAIGRTSGERVGYPTQKPLALYERMILASSNEGDIVLDPFCGCATTCIAAERTNRRWLGMDIWGKTPDVVKSRLENEGLLHNEKSTHLGIMAKDITFTHDAPIRTDDGQEAVPFLAVKESHRVAEEKDGYSNIQRKDILVEQHGMICQGCGFKPPDKRYLELDHDMARVSGGSNNIDNRILLCAPCNKKKGAGWNLWKLRKENKKEGLMMRESLPDIKDLKAQIRLFLAKERA